MISISLLFFQADFLTNHNAQSLVEICITRLTSAVRETGTIETLAAPLVSFEILEFGSIGAAKWTLKPVSRRL